MKIIKKIVILLTATHLLSCASYTSSIPKESSPLQESSYIYGTFTKSGLPGFGLVIENMATPDKYIFQFTKNKKVSMIRVNPGSYEITKFIASNAFGGIEGEKELYGWPFKTTVKIKSSEVYYAGDFIAKFHTESGNLTWAISDYKNNFESVTKELNREYSGFKDMKKTVLFN